MAPNTKICIVIVPVLVIDLHIVGTVTFLREVPSGSTSKEHSPEITLKYYYEFLFLFF